MFSKISKFIKISCKFNRYWCLHHGLRTPILIGMCLLNYKSYIEDLILSVIFHLGVPAFWQSLATMWHEVMTLPWFIVTWGFDWSDFWGQPGSLWLCVRAPTSWCESIRVSSLCKWSKYTWKQNLFEWKGSYLY